MHHTHHTQCITHKVLVTFTAMHDPGLKMVGDPAYFPEIIPPEKTLGWEPVSAMMIMA